ncbi:HAD family hydrolase [Clostridioides difficile]
MIKAVIFDLDGTLLDTLEDLANACNYALKVCGFKTHNTCDYVKFVGNGRYKLIERIVPEEYKKNEDIINKVLELFDQYYGQHMIDMTKPYDGIYEMLEELNKKHIKLAVVSNKPHEFAEDVVKKYFGETFEITYGQRPNHPTKPDPKTVFEVMESLKVDKTECIYVGDSDVDVNTAKNADVKSVGVDWGFRGAGELREAGADYIIEKPAELITLVSNNYH